MSEAIELMAKAIHDNWQGTGRGPAHRTWEETCEKLPGQAESFRAYARSAVEALWTPTEAMWGGLARDLVMWDRGMPNQYGSTLYKHLAWTGRPIPDWLRSEIPDTDHTPPKGTVAVCIFRAMLEASALTGKDGSAAS